MPSFLAKHWFLMFLALAVGVTLLVPGPMHVLTDYWEPRRTIAISLFLMAWTMPTHSLVSEFRKPWASLWAVVLSYGLLPVIAWLMGRLVDSDDVRIGLILVSTAPCTLSSAVLWTRMAGGNEATALLTVVGTTFTSWFLTTLWLLVLTGAMVQLDIRDVGLDLILSLILPVMLGQAIRLIGPCARFAERHKVALGTLSQLFVLAIVLKAGVAVGDRLRDGDVPSAPAIFLWSVALAVALHLVALSGGLVSSRLLGFDRGRQIAVAFSASQKTLQVSLVLYDQYYKSDFPFAVIVLLFYHVGQLLFDTLIARHLQGERPASAECRVQSAE